MAEYAVLVNGPPGSGKSALAARLAPRLAVPLISGDAIEEALTAAAPGAPAHVYSALADRVVWDLATAMPGGVVLESWWSRDRDAARAGLTRCGATAAVEIWCDVPLDLALTRNLRHPVAPLGIAELITVAAQPDLPPLVARITEVLRRQRGGSAQRLAGTAPRPPSPLPNAAGLDRK